MFLYHVYIDFYMYKKLIIDIRYSTKYKADTLLWIAFSISLLISFVSMIGLMLIKFNN